MSSTETSHQWRAFLFSCVSCLRRSSGEMSWQGPLWTACGTPCWGWRRSWRSQWRTCGNTWGMATLSPGRRRESCQCPVCRWVWRDSPRWRASPRPSLPSVSTAGRLSSCYSRTRPRPCPARCLRCRRGSGRSCRHSPRSSRRRSCTGWRGGWCSAGQSWLQRETWEPQWPSR